MARRGLELGPDLVKRVAARLEGRERGESFSRGLVLGALVGSAIAGSTIWARLRERRASQSAGGRDVIDAGGGQA